MSPLLTEYLQIAPYSEPFLIGLFGLCSLLLGMVSQRFQRQDGKGAPVPRTQANAQVALTDSPAVAAHLGSQVIANSARVH